MRLWRCENFMFSLISTSAREKPSAISSYLARAYELSIPLSVVFTTWYLPWPQSTKLPWRDLCTCLLGGTLRTNPHGKVRCRNSLLGSFWPSLTLYPAFAPTDSLHLLPQPSPSLYWEAHYIRDRWRPNLGSETGNPPTLQLTACTPLPKRRHRCF